MKKLFFLLMVLNSFQLIAQDSLSKTDHERDSVAEGNEIRAAILLKQKQYENDLKSIESIIDPKTKKDLQEKLREKYSLSLDIFKEQSRHSEDEKIYPPYKFQKSAAQPRCRVNPCTLVNEDFSFNTKEGETKKYPSVSFDSTKPKSFTLYNNGDLDEVNNVWHKNDGYSEIIAGVDHIDSDQLKCANFLSNMNPSVNNIGRGDFFKTGEEGIFVPGKQKKYFSMVYDDKLYVVNENQVRSQKLSKLKLPASDLTYKDKARNLPIKVGDRVMCLGYHNVNGKDIEFSSAKDQFYYCPYNENKDKNVDKRSRSKDGKPLVLTQSLDIDIMNKSTKDTIKQVDKMLLGLLEKAADRLCEDETNKEIFSDPTKSQSVAAKYPRHFVNLVASNQCAHLSQEKRCELEKRVRECYPKAYWMPKMSEKSACKQGMDKKEEVEIQLEK